MSSDRRITEFSLSGVVHLEGRQNLEGVNRFLGISHLFVAPFVETEAGDKDGIPTAMLEGMSTGMPVVATDAGSITEVVESGRNGIVVPQRDPAAIADAVESLLLDPERRRRMGSCAAAHVRSRFDVRDCEEAFHARVRAVLSH
jgi:glycosyltransferase involved in cell wall biosynthesis